MRGSCFPLFYMIRFQVLIMIFSFFHGGFCHAQTRVCGVKARFRPSAACPEKLTNISLTLSLAMDTF